MINAAESRITDSGHQNVQRLRSEWQNSPSDGFSSSIKDLVDTYQQSKGSRYAQARALFEHEHGRIIEEYFASSIRAGVVLVRERASWWKLRRGHYRIELAYDYGRSNPELDEELRNIRNEERQAGILLRGRAQQILVKTA